MFKSLGSLVKPIFDADERVVKKLRAQVDEINELEPQFEAMSDAQLAEMTDEFRARYNDGEPLDELMSEVFAAVREAARRRLQMRHYDVQIMGGIVLHQGKIAELKTGEGKTLVATLAGYLNAIAAPPVHMVTVNDYLVYRDTAWMGAVYAALGMSVSCIQGEQKSYRYNPLGTDDIPSDKRDGDGADSKMIAIARQEAYRADIVYGTNNEFGFDYLRDNMCFGFEQMVQNGGGKKAPEFRYAIVDEVDNIFIDEARTPLIISGPAPNLSDQYIRFAQIAKHLSDGRDFEVEAKRQEITFTPDGIARIEKMLGVGNLYSVENQSLSHYAENAVRAERIFMRDRNYIVKEGKIVLVDDFTGRLMPGRRLSDGLHEALEAKEGVKIQRGSVTLATITLQNYFRQYDKLSGMTGTAALNAEEFFKIYKLDVVVIPPNREDRREDLPDQIYITERAKWKAVVNKIVELHRDSVPVLVGTTSVDKSEDLAKMLLKRQVRANVLNARNHAREAEIIAAAGEPGAVTVSNNMAGRGTDIILGGKPAAVSVNGKSPDGWESLNRRVKDLGGLFVLGTERHEARRIDSQLRGRAGRQGDVGKTQFFLSTEDEIIKRFGGERIANMLNRLKWDEDEVIENRVLERMVNSAQQKVEAYYFEQRKRLVDYDDVINEQRKTIYKLRRRFLDADTLRELLEEYILDELDALVTKLWRASGLPMDNLNPFRASFLAILPDAELIPSDDILANTPKPQALGLFDGKVEEMYNRRAKQFGAEKFAKMLQVLSLRALDANWVQHLTAMDNMRQSIGLQAVGQRDPLTQYKHQSFQMFSGLVENTKLNITHTMFRIKVAASNRVSAGSPGAGAKPGAKLGRNDPCGCGSGKKFKKCHGA